MANSIIGNERADLSANLVRCVDVHHDSHQNLDLHDKNYERSVKIKVVYASMNRPEMVFSPCIH